MLFHFLYFSQGVCLGIKRSTKLQISKSTPKGDILFFKKIPFQELQRMARLDYKVFSCICDITNCNPRLRNSWLGGGTLG